MDYSPHFARIGMTFLGMSALVLASPPSRFTLPARPDRHPLSRRNNDITGTFSHAHFSKDAIHIARLLDIRGGNDDPSSPSDGAPLRSSLYQSQNYQQQQQLPQQPLPQQPPPPQPQQQQQQSEYSFDDPLQSIDENAAFQETFQDRIDKWRNYQMEHAEEQRLSLRDGQGRLKLLTSVSKASRAITFFILMWRNVHLYEVVDQKMKGSLRYLGVVPLTFLFIANLAGVVVSLASPGHASKKRLKAILNLDKLMELVLILYHIGKLIFSTSNLVPREIYISHILHSVFFLMQCQTVTRFVWDESLPTAATSQAAGPYPQNDDEDNSHWMQQNQQQRPGQYGSNNKFYGQTSSEPNG